jgi:anthranilate synthase component 1
MEIIEELERTRRGIYAGGVLYMDFAGNLDSCIALRTMVIKNGMAYVQAGGGVVADSTPVGEYQETLNKSRALLTALESAHLNRGRAMAAAGAHGKKGRRQYRHE